MNKRVGAIAIAVLICTLVLAGIALAQPGGGSVKPVSAADLSSAATLSGGHYQLTSVTLGYTQGNASQESEVASGGGYHLQALDSPRLTGNGCCCTYLPCVIR